MRGSLDGEALHLVGVLLEVEELEIVVGGQCLERGGRGEIVGRVVACEFVPAVKDEADEAARRHVRIM